MFGLLNGVLLALPILSFDTRSASALFVVCALACAAASVFACRFVIRSYDRLETGKPIYSFTILFISSLLFFTPFLLEGDIGRIVVVSIAFFALLTRTLFFKTRRLEDIGGTQPSKKKTPETQTSTSAPSEGTLTRNKPRHAPLTLFGLRESTYAEFAGSVMTFAFFQMTGVRFGVSWELLAIMILEYVLIMAVVLGEVFFVPVGKENTTFTVVETNMEEVCAKVAEEYGLTRREAEVLTIMAAGYSMPYIQEKLCIERGTVTSHCSHIYQKLGVHKRDELYDLLAKKAREPSQR